LLSRVVDPGLHACTLPAEPPLSIRTSCPTDELVNVVNTVATTLTTALGPTRYANGALTNSRAGCTSTVTEPHEVEQLDPG